MHIVIVSTDLAVGAVAAANSGADCQVSVAMSLARLRELLHEGPVDVIVLDLQSVSLDKALVEELRSKGADGCRIAAFAPHVHESRLAGALESGCDHVWTKGQWSQQLSALLRQQSRN